MVRVRALCMETNLVVFLLSRMYALAAAAPGADCCWLTWCPRTFSPYTLRIVVGITVSPVVKA